MNNELAKLHLELHAAALGLMPYPSLERIKEIVFTPGEPNCSLVKYKDGEITGAELTDAVLKAVGIERQSDKKEKP